MSAPQLVVADGYLGIWAALAAVFPKVAEQRCWNHKVVNVLRRRQTLPIPFERLGRLGLLLAVARPKLLALPHGLAPRRRILHAAEQLPGLGL